MKAVVADKLDHFAVSEVTLDPPKMGEVLVKMKATGVCHSDLSVINGTIPSPFPVVLGHEGAGIVEAVGDGVTNVEPGDHVVLSFIPQCGDCFYCVHDQPFLCSVAKQDGNQFDGTTRVHRGDEGIFVMSFLGNMAEYAVVPSVCVIAVDKAFDFKTAALVGCGITTGVGAAIKTADVRPGSTVAVFGCGGVGLSVIQGARLAGAKRIIAVDLSAEKMALATEFGATETVTPGGDSVREILEMTNGLGVDYAFEVIGLPATIEQCVKVARRGGAAVLVGVGRATDRFSVNSLILPLTGKSILGCMYGSANFKSDFPTYLDLYRQGKLDLDRMVTKTYDLDDAPQAFEDMRNGANARGVIIHA
ncbi:MAG: Zn-dependent alcohol dehydrogenase [Pseudomonadota bacterium]